MRNSPHGRSPDKTAREEAHQHQRTKTPEQKPKQASQQTREADFHETSFKQPE